MEVTTARESYRRGVHPRQRRRLQYPPELNALPNFSTWLGNVVQAGRESFDEDVVDLSVPPNFRVRSFKSMKAYGKQFRVCNAELNLITADFGVTVTSETLQRSGLSDANLVSGSVIYFGKVMEILELDYGRLKPVVLLCDWVSPIFRGPTACIKKDLDGFTLVKLNRLMRRSANSFVFPIQASQIFFIDSGDDPEWSVVVHTNPRTLRVYQATDVCDPPHLFDGGEGFLGEDLKEVESDANVEEANEETVACGQHVTEEEYLRSDAVVQIAAQQGDDEGSNDDTVFEFDGDAD